MSSVIDSYQKIVNSVESQSLDAGHAVQLIAVSKRHPSNKMQELIDVYPGQVIFGENFVQEYAEKHSQLQGDFQVHMIGKLQSNKAKLAVELFDCIQTIDRLKIAREINKQAERIDKEQEVLLQVNISEDPHKNGFSVNELKEQFPEILDLQNLKIKGLMTITYDYADPEQARPDFKKMRILADDLEQTFNLSGLELSMGMSADYAVAIAEGATMVRVGTAIFGSRE